MQPWQVFDSLSEEEKKKRQQQGLSPSQSATIENKKKMTPSGVFDNLYPTKNKTTTITKKTTPTPTPTPQPKKNDLGSFLSNLGNTIKNAITNAIPQLSGREQSTVPNAPSTAPTMPNLSTIKPVTEEQKKKLEDINKVAPTPSQEADPSSDLTTEIKTSPLMQNFNKKVQNIFDQTAKYLQNPVDPTVNTALNLLPGVPATMKLYKEGTQPLDVLKGINDAIRSKIEKVNPTAAGVYDMATFLVPGRFEYFLAKEFEKSPKELDKIWKEKGTTFTEKLGKTTGQVVLPLTMYIYAPKILEKFIPSPTIKEIEKILGSSYKSFPELFNLLGNVASVVGKGGSRGGGTMLLINAAQQIKAGMDAGKSKDDIINEILKTSPTAAAGGTIFGIAASSWGIAEPKLFGFRKEYNPEVFTPEQIKNQVKGTDANGTQFGNDLMKAATEAEATGKNVKVSAIATKEGIVTEKLGLEKAKTIAGVTGSEVVTGKTPGGNGYRIELVDGQAPIQQLTGEKPTTKETTGEIVKSEIVPKPEDMFVQNMKTNKIYKVPENLKQQFKDLDNEGSAKNKDWHITSGLSESKATGKLIIEGSATKEMYDEMKSGIIDNTQETLDEIRKSTLPEYNTNSEIVKLDAFVDEVRKLDPENELDKFYYDRGDRYQAKISYPYSLGENGNYQELQYKDKPTIEEIKNDILDIYKEEKIKINEELSPGIVAKSGRDENIEKAIDKVMPKEQPSIPKELEPITSGKIPVYHGTKYQFEEFNPSQLGKVTKVESAKNAFFFTDKKSIAEGYANLGDMPSVDAQQEIVNKLEKQAQKSGLNSDWEKFNKAQIKLEELAYGEENKNFVGNVKEVYLNLKNPFIKDMGGMAYDEKQLANIVKEAKSKGYDGFILKNAADSVNTPIGGGVRPENELSNIYGVFDKKSILTQSTKGVETLSPNENIKANQKLNEDIFKTLYYAQEQNKELQKYGNSLIEQVRSKKISIEKAKELLDKAFNEAKYRDLNTGELVPLSKPIEKKVEPTIEKAEPYKRGTITKLENKINELAGYTPTEGNWKMEYHVRNAYIDEALENAPPEIQKELQDTIDELSKIRESRKDISVSFASKGVFAELENLTKTPSNKPIVEFPELVRIAKELTGKLPEVKNYLNQALGRAYPGDLLIKLQKDIFKDPEQAAKVLAHEIGHIIDFLPQKIREKTLLVGRILSLNNFMKQVFGDLKDKELRMELKKLSYEWRPLPDGVETKYRKKSAELYADAISVLLNDPVRLQKTAPKFWKAFFDNLDKKPTAKKALEDIWAMINEGEDKVFQERDKELDRSFKEGEKAYTAKYLDKQNRKSSLWYQMKLLFDDKNTPILEKIREVEKKGGIIPPELNPDYALKGLLYSEGELKNYINDFFQPIYSKVQEVADGWNQLGKIVFYDRVINERGEFANPQGYSPKTAGDQLKKMEETLGVEDWKKLQEAKELFRKAVQESVDYAEKNGYYTPELIAQMKANPSYATFQVVDYLDTYITAKVYQQKGTLKDIANPATSTVMKLISLRKAIKRNNAKKLNVKFMNEHFGDEIEDAKLKWNGKNMEIMSPKEEGKDLILTIEEGKPKGYYVDQDIANMLNYNSNQTLEAMAKISRTVSQGRFYRPLFTMYNLGFQSFNFVRDLRRAWKNMPQRTLKDVPLSPIIDAFKLTRGYIKALKPAYARVFDKPNELIKEMENANMLGFTYNDIYSGEINEETQQIERILQQVGILEPEVNKSFIRKTLTPFTWVLDKVGEVGDFIETLPKVAGYIELKNSMPEKELSDFVRTSVGSPAFKVGGTATPISNNIFLFSNAIKEGLKSDIRIASGKRGKASAAAFWWKSVLADFMPKFIMFAIGAGLFGSKLKQIMDQTSEYDKANYTIIPLGQDEKGKAIILRIPSDETGRFMGGLLWKILNVNKDEVNIQDFFDIFSFGAGQFPNLSPSFTGAGALIEYLSGNNPYDSFRNRFIIPDTQYKAGFKYSFPIFMDWLLKNQGLGIMFPSYKPDNPTTLEKLLNAPVLSNIIGRWVKVTDYGETEALTSQGKKVDQQNAERLLKEREKVQNAIDEYKKNPTLTNKLKIRNQLVKDVVGNMQGTQAKTKKTNTLKKFEIGILYKSVSTQLDSLINASSNEEKIQKMQLIKDQISTEEFNKMIKVALKYKIVSKETYNEYKKRSKK